MKTHRIRVLAALCGVALAVVPAAAQFNSGSTGEDGALNITQNTTLPVQPDGVHNYTTLNVATGATLTFTPNALNTPVIFLATGDVTINGAINLTGGTGLQYYEANAGLPGSNAKGGSGGYRGGVGAIAAFKGGSGIAEPGGGAGGGAAANDPNPDPQGIGLAGNGGSHFTPGEQYSANPNPPAPTYGDPRLLTLSGGSGGAGGNAFITQNSDYDGPGGGGGGGALLIASSTSIVVNGSIVANGGTAGSAANYAGGGSRGAGGGAGGAIRLMASSISGTGSMSTIGGNGVASGGNGLIRIEGFSVSGNLANNANPSPFVGLPSVVSLPPANLPTVRITSISGLPVPNPPTGSSTVPDVIIPSSTSNPISIQVATTNVPDGAIIRLRIALTSGDIVTANSTPVAGGAASASVTLPRAIGVVYATADFNP